MTQGATESPLQDYRCTFPELYPKPADGHKDPKARQGFFVQAADEADAERVITEEWPKHGKPEVELWVPGGR